MEGLLLRVLEQTLGRYVVELNKTSNLQCGRVMLRGEDTSKWTDEYFEEFVWAAMQLVIASEDGG